MMEHVPDLPAGILVLQFLSHLVKFLKQANADMPGILTPNFDPFPEHADKSKEGLSKQVPAAGRPERAVEAGRRRHRGKPFVGLSGQQVTEPPVGVHLGQRQVAEAAVGPRAVIFEQGFWFGRYALSLGRVRGPRSV